MARLKYTGWRLFWLMVFLLGTFAAMVWVVLAHLSEGRREAARREAPQQTKQP